MLRKLIWWVLVIIALVVLAYILFFRSYSMGGPQAWAEFGDYVGGILSPVIAFAAFIGLLWTIRIQQTELSATRTELKESTKAQRQSADAQEKSLGVAYATALVRLLEEAHSNLAALESQQVPIHLKEKGNENSTLQTSVNRTFKNMRLSFNPSYKPSSDDPETAEFFEAMSNLLYSIFNMCRACKESTGQDVIGLHYWIVLGHLIRDLDMADALWLPEWVGDDERWAMVQWASLTKQHIKQEAASD